MYVVEEFIVDMETKAESRHTQDFRTELHFIDSLTASIEDTDIDECLTRSLYFPYVQTSDVYELANITLLAPFSMILRGICEVKVGKYYKSYTLREASSKYHYKPKEEDG